MADTLHPMPGHIIKVTSYVEDRVILYYTWSVTVDLHVHVAKIRPRDQNPLNIRTLWMYVCVQRTQFQADWMSCNTVAVSKLSWEVIVHLKTFLECEFILLIWGAWWPAVVKIIRLSLSHKPQETRGIIHNPQEPWRWQVGLIHQWEELCLI